jgi:hypothetical protein
MTDINNKFFEHSIDILKGYKLVFKQMIDGNSINSLSDERIMLNEIYSELDIFISRLYSESSLIFGEYSNSVPLKVIQSVSTKPMIAINSLVNYIEGLSEDYQTDSGYEDIVSIINEFSKFLESKIYEINTMDIFSEDDDE